VELITVQLCGLLLSLALSFFCSASEIAFTGLERAQVLVMLKSRRPGALFTARWHRRPDALLVTLLVGNNLVNITFTTFATLLGLQLGWPEWATALAATLVLTLGGESVPKTLAHGRSRTLFPSLALPLRLLQGLVWPVAAPITLLLRLLPGSQEREVLQLRDHLSLMTHDLSRSGDLGQDESRMIRRALDLHQRRLSELMTPRTELMALPQDASPAEAAARILEGGRSSLPLYRGDLDHITGYITARDLFQRPSSLKEIRREPLYVPESMKARDLLGTFGGSPSRLAVVLDEYGGTAGLLTLEDLLEDLVGAIEDEHDHARRDWVPLADGRIFAPARMRLDAFAARSGIQLDGEVAETLGGWIVEQLGRIPVEGERLQLHPLNISVVSATPRLLRHVIVEVQQGPGQHEDGN
jgi:putative hemolysin